MIGDAAAWRGVVIQTGDDGVRRSAWRAQVLQSAMTVTASQMVTSGQPGEAFV